VYGAMDGEKTVHSWVLEEEVVIIKYGGQSS